MNKGRWQVPKFAGQREDVGQGKIPRYNEGDCKGESIKTAHKLNLEIKNCHERIK